MHRAASEESGSNGNVTNIGRALGISLEELARAAIITQANALVLLRQARADLFKDDQELSAKLSAGQAAFEAKAKYYLSRLQPNIIHRVSDADAAKNLFVPAVGILRQRLAGPRGDAMQGGGADNGVIIDQIKWQITSYRDEARELNRLRRGREEDNMAAHVPANFRRVITAAAAGNVIEWYDFYIFGSLAAILSVKFFEKSHPVAALLSTIALFTAGFLVRPLGAFLFGWLGDRVGRKYTFIMTLVGMALGTGAIGFDPDLRLDRLGRRVYPVRFADDPGPSSPGGSYGGAITYVAEHVSDERRGY